MAIGLPEQVIHQEWRSITVDSKESGNEGERLLGTISDILSGSYHGEIDDIRRGNYNSTLGKKRIWKWEDRARAISELIEREKVSFGSIDASVVGELGNILYNNMYLRRKHRGTMEGVFNTICSPWA